MVSTALKSTRGDECVVNGAANYPVGGGILDDGKVSGPLKTNQSKPPRNVLKALHRLIRCCTVRCRNSSQCRINLGETVGRTTCRLRVTPDKEIHTGSVMRVVSQKNRYQCRRIEENGHLKRSERCEIAFTPNRLQRVVDNRRG